MTQLQNTFGTPYPVAIVTGAGSPRVGRVVAHTLAKRGYRVVVHANRAIEEAEATAAKFRAAGGNAMALSADLTSEADVQRLVQTALEAFGGLHALVHCAAIWPRVTLEETTADHVRQCFEANTLSTFLCCQHAGLAMCGQAWGGAIVTVGDWAIKRPYADYAAYFASKGSIPTLTRTFAVELAARNPRVRANCVLPGPVMLPADLPEPVRAAAIAGTLVKREGTPQHLADAIVALLENDFITGACLPVDGGRTVCGE